MFTVRTVLVYVLFVVVVFLHIALSIHFSSAPLVLCVGIDLRSSISLICFKLVLCIVCAIYSLSSAMFSSFIS